MSCVDRCRAYSRCARRRCATGAFGAASVVFSIVLDKFVKDPDLVAWRPHFQWAWPRLADALVFGPMFRSPRTLQGQLRSAEYIRQVC